jgi:glycosyltransferase involved in cell wall biosynthesis
MAVKLRIKLFISTVFGPFLRGIASYQAWLSFKNNRAGLNQTVSSFKPVADITSAELQELQLLFDVEWYLKQNPDVTQAGIDPLVHYLRQGAWEGRDPNPLFDSDWYLERNPDVRQVGINPLVHYIKYGAVESRDPSTVFSSRMYLSNYPDIRELGINPLVHYLLYGRVEGYSAFSYTDWVKQYDTLTELDRAVIRADIARMGFTPRISVVMPVYNTPEVFLRCAIDSVIDQLYPHWELCIADDASPEPQVRQVLEEYTTRESRIRVIYREENGHISAASNSALTLATGEFVALLDHDDELPPHALYLVANEIETHPDADIVYSDEDKIDEAGNRYDPHFKPDVNPELLYSQNYISHLGVYRRSLVEAVGGFRVGYEGSQDYDLLLRCYARTQPARVRHIPRVLYHWRAVSGSTARAVAEKSYAAEAARRALEDYFHSRGEEAEVTHGTVPTTYRVQFPLPQPQPLVSIIIPTRNGVQLLRTCVSSVLEKTRYEAYEIVIVDNQSDEPATLAYLDELRAHLRCRVLRYDAPFNFSAINNFAVRKARGEFVLLLNNDTEVITPEWLDELVMWGSREGIGAVGCKLLYPNGTIQHAGIVLGMRSLAGHYHKNFPGNSPGYFGRMATVHEVGGNTAACLLVRRDTYLAVGGLDEENLRVAFNDVDFCLKLRQAGLRNLWTPYAVLYHHESKTRGLADTPAKWARAQTEVEYMKSYWGDTLLYDPAYSPNLTLQHEDLSLAWPPRVPPLSLQQLGDNLLSVKQSAAGRHRSA